MKDTKKIDDALRRMAITVRMGVDTGDYTREEITEYITERGNKHFEEILNMDCGDFVIMVLNEMADMMAERAEVQGE